ncbi:MAG: SRPBCC family protein [bacterium]|nr:SRPBCC family protein [bacterium]
MKLFKIFAAIIGFFAFIFMVSLFFPHQYRIEKTTVINLPVYETFDYMNKVENWADWSPWNTDLDSSMVFFYSQKKSGVGAAQYFRGGLIGTGRFRIIKSLNNQVITFHLSIDESFMSINQTFYFKELGGKTQLSWVDEGDVGYNPIFRFLLPSRIGGTEAGFEEGLIVIKAAAEKHAVKNRGIL